MDTKTLGGVNKVYAHSRKCTFKITTDNNHLVVRLIINGGYFNNIKTFVIIAVMNKEIQNNMNNNT